MRIKINFVDFWPNFKKEDNYFFNLLRTKYDVVIDEGDPDLLFFSVDYGKRRTRNRYLNHRCKKIFFTGENVRANLDGPESIEYPEYSIGKCDIAFTNDYNNEPRDYRLPLWVLYINWFNKPYDRIRDPSYLIPLTDITNFYGYSIRYFCNFLFSHSSGERINILKTIQKYKSVHCPGRLMNNCQPIGGRGDQIEKINFISMFKFTIAAENAKHDGYTTEKMIHPLSVGSIPIYWGSDRVTEEFNEKAFINANKLSGQDLLDTIIEIDKDDKLYQSIRNESVFPDNKIPEYALPESVLKFIESTVLCSI